MKVLFDDLFYTKEHDWIRFSPPCAHIGISRFKLTGIYKIDDIGLTNVKMGDIIEQGKLLLNLYYKEYIIPLHAPITCKLLEVHSIVQNGLWELIIQHPEEEGWLFKVEPRQQDKSHLLHHTIYKEGFLPSSIIQPNC